MPRYINPENIKLNSLSWVDGGEDILVPLIDVRKAIAQTPSEDVVAVIRCKECKHFQPCFVMTPDGERRPYTEEEIRKGKMVTGDIGINCGSRCERFGYWDENKIPVWFNENDFCSYGERKENEISID